MNRLLLLFILCLVIGGGCRSKNGTIDKPQVTVSILPLKYFVDRISGEDFDVSLIVPPGASPETYEPTVSQMKQLSRSDICFQLGLIDFEKALSDGISNNAPGLKMVNLSDKLDLIEGESDHHHHGTDPHIWLSPVRMKSIAVRIADQLAEINPDSSVKYQNNLRKLTQSIDSVDSYILSSFSNLKNNIFIIYHPFLSYYAQDYGLVQLPVEYEGKEPASSQMKELTTKARSEKLSVIFYQKQFSRTTVDALAAEAGLTPEVIDPLAYNWIDNMIVITDQLKKSMER